MSFSVERLLLFSSDNRDDQLPRICVLAFLSRLDSSNLQHEKLMEELVMALLKKVTKSHIQLHTTQGNLVFAISYADFKLFSYVIIFQPKASYYHPFNVKDEPISVFSFTN